MASKGKKAGNSKTSPETDATTGDAAPVDAAAPTKAAKVPREQQNGITRPATGTMIGALWDIADELTEKNNGVPIPRKIVVEAYMADVENANKATAHTQYARWQKYHGHGDALKESKAERKAAREEERKAQAEQRKADREAAKAEKTAAKKAATTSNEQAAA